MSLTRMRLNDPHSRQEKPAMKRWLLIAILTATAGCNATQTETTQVKWQAALINPSGAATAAWHLHSQDSPRLSLQTTGVTTVHTDGKVVLSAPIGWTYRVQHIGTATNQPALVPLTIEVYPETQPPAEPEWSFVGHYNGMQTPDGSSQID